MGACFSSSSSSSPSFNNIRVIHFNGYVEDFDKPVSVDQVTGKPAQHFICTPAQLVSVASKPSLKPETLLEPGKIYLMLPFSTLRPDVSSMDLASISKKLTAAAKNRRCQAGKTRPATAMRSPCRVEKMEGTAMVPARRSTGSGSWKPILDTIKEKPLNQRSESDLHEKYEVEMEKNLSR